MRIHLLSVSVQTIGFAAGLCILSSQMAIAGGGDSVQVTLPRDLDSTGRTHTLEHGTRVFRVPSWTVEYQVLENGSIKTKGSVLHNVASIRRVGSETIITFSNGTVDHFPASAAVHSDGALVLRFIHPGQAVPPSLKARAPDYIVP